MMHNREMRGTEERSSRKGKKEGSGGGRGFAHLESANNTQHECSCSEASPYLPSGSTFSSASAKSSTCHSKEETKY